MPALIDSGAARTVLTPETIRMLGLPIVDYTTLSRAGGTDKVSVHVASLQFPRYKFANIEVIQVLSCELPEVPFQCLLGRDILSRWLFTYNGRTGEWSIDEEHHPPQVGYDVFVSYASEDISFVEPLASALKAAGINAWYDRDRMKWGDDIRKSIDQGLLGSRSGIVVFSKAFFLRKRWTEHELNGLFAKEKTSKTVILPIWHGVTQDDLAEYSPSFVDRLAMDSQRNSIEDIVRNLKSLLGQTP
jgi:TIR domain/gag-polyprotein putative aspartyl protease